MEARAVPPPAAQLIGLRERKKQRTRQAIADVATALFAERGFEAVTMAEIADAADVSVKTIFNYFSSKEELYFDRAGEVLDVLRGAVTGRAAGETVTASIRRLFTELRVPIEGGEWRALRSPEAYEAIRAFIETEHASPALRARRLVLAESWARELAATAAAEIGLRPDDQRVEAWSAMVVGAMVLRERTMARLMLERRPAARVRKETIAVGEEAFARVARAFEDVPGL